MKLSVFYCIIFGNNLLINNGGGKKFIGKVCTIILFNESFGVQGKIVAVEDNWIKVEEKNKVRLINGDMIRDISIAPEKYQK